MINENEHVVMILLHDFIMMGLQRLHFWIKKNLLTLFVIGLLQVFKLLLLSLRLQCFLPPLPPSFSLCILSSPLLTPSAVTLTTFTSCLLLFFLPISKSPLLLLPSSCSLQLSISYSLHVCYQSLMTQLSSLKLTVEHTQLEKQHWEERWRSAQVPPLLPLLPLALVAAFFRSAWASAHTVFFCSNFPTVSLFFFFTSLLVLPLSTLASQLPPSPFRLSSCCCHFFFSLTLPFHFVFPFNSWIPLSGHKYLKAQWVIQSSV